MARHVRSRSALLLASVAMLVLPGALAHVAMAEGATTAAAGVAELSERLAEASMEFARRLGVLLASGQQRAPAVVVGLAGLLAVPLLALAVTAGRRLRRQRTEPGCVRRPPALDTPHTFVRPTARAWVEIPGQRNRSHLIIGEILRIGRHDDNDLTFADASVQHYHALIRRTPEAEYIVVDLTGAPGNGIAVNGRRLSQSLLRDGDLIEVGGARVVFHRELTRLATQPTASALTH